MKYELQSGFAKSIREFIEHRAHMGHSTAEYQNKLANFDRFCREHFSDASTITQGIAFAWCDDAKGNGGAGKARAIRCFARYLLITGEDAYVMPTSFFPQQKPKLPVIMNDTETQRFFQATDCYPSSARSPLLEYTVPVILRLIYACGMRPQEARCLKRLDFNFRDGTIYVAEGKHNKDRCLPVSENIVNMCEKYDRIVETINPSRTYFFESPASSFYKPRWLEAVFDNCWRISGNDVGRGYCTPYALRHNFATQTLMRWIEEGRNLDAMIPYLSAYMGHENFSSTYYYIHLLPDRLAKLDFTKADYIIPEVSEYEEER